MNPRIVAGEEAHSIAQSDLGNGQAKNGRDAGEKTVEYRTMGFFRLPALGYLPAIDRTACRGRRCCRRCEQQCAGERLLIQSKRAERSRERRIEGDVEHLRIGLANLRAGFDQTGGKRRIACA